MKRNKHAFTVRSAPAANEAEGKKIIRGFIPYNSPSEWMGFTEYLAPTAFNKTLADGADVKALRNHDASQILGRTKNGTLTLSSTEEGLVCELEVNDGVSYARDLYAAVKRGDVDTMSFCFSAIKEEILDEGKTRIIKEARLYEVSFGVTFPAYPETTSEAMTRSIEEILEMDYLDEAGITLLSETKAKIDARLAQSAPPPSQEPLPPESSPDDTVEMEAQVAVALSLT